MATLKGVFTNCDTEQETVENLEYEIKDNIFSLLQGVTGFESFTIREDNIANMSKWDWTACMGTKPESCLAGWDKLYIPAFEMNKVFEAEELTQEVA